MHCRAAVQEQFDRAEHVSRQLGGFLIEAMMKHRLATIRMPQSTALGGSNVFEMVLLGAFLHGFHLDRASGIERKGFAPEGLIIADSDLLRAQAVRRTADAVNKARAWVEQPANLLTPSVWAEETRQAFAERNARVRVVA